MVLVIGSTAIHRLFPEFREPKDFDCFASPEEVASGVIGGNVADVFWDKRLEPWLNDFTRDSGFGGVWFANLDELYTIKVSHSYWDLRNGSWLKHIEDADWLKQRGAKLIPDLHSLLREIWTDKHGSKDQMQLSKGADQFFADAVKRRYDHDSVHASVSYFAKPLYEDLLKPGQTVAMDMAKLKSWPKEKQVLLFREEIYATALERIMIPNDYDFSPLRAYVWALRRTITSLTKGWSAQFLVENYDLFRRPDCDYVARHLSNTDKLIPLEEK